MASRTLAENSQFTEPSIEVTNRAHALGKHREIASVDQNVAVGHLNLAMKLMGVTQKDKAQCGSFS
jgi:hypothetical protein